MKFAHHGPDLVGVVEAAYKIDVPNSEWVTGLIDAMRPAVEDGLGMAAYLYDTSERPFRIHDLVQQTPVSDAGLEILMAANNDDYVRRSWNTPSVSLASETQGFVDYPAVQEAFYPVGIRDVFAINARDDVGIGCWIGAPLRKLSQIDDATRERWGRVAAHVRAALRLRLRLASQSSHIDGSSAAAEAVLRVTGEVEHLEHQAVSAKASLRDAVVAMNRARQELRPEPERALRAWRVLVKGRWSLIDDFRTGGEHYVVARANSITTLGIDQLTAREAQVAACLANGLTNKETAYELGISDSTVRVLVGRGCEKLQVNGRAALIAAYRAEALKR